MFLVRKWMRKVPSFHQFTHFNLMLKFCPWKCTQLRCNLVRTGTKPFTLIISIVVYIYASSSVPVAKATIYLNVCFFNLRYTYFHLLHYIGVCVISNMYKSYTYPWPRDSSMFPPSLSSSLSSSQTLPNAHVHSWAVFSQWMQVKNVHFHSQYEISPVVPQSHFIRFPLQPIVFNISLQCSTFHPP